MFEICKSISCFISRINTSVFTISAPKIWAPCEERKKRSKGFIAVSRGIKKVNNQQQFGKNNRIPDLEYPWNRTRKKEL